MSDTRGFFAKYCVRRLDGSDAPGGKHHGCELFVLDISHDPHAVVALRAYADECVDSRPNLSKDLRILANTAALQFGLPQEPEA